MLIKTDQATSPLTFKILEPGNILWKHTGGQAQTIEYSKNRGAWLSITSSVNGTAIPVNPGDKLRFRGTDWPGASASNYHSFGSDCRFEASGNPVSLKVGEHPTGLESLANYAFSGLFQSARLLQTPPVLPATDLVSNCYYHLFNGCWEMRYFPNLPATILKYGCYDGMFYECRQCTEIVLPAKVLMGNCYSWMLRGCTNLSYIECLAEDLSAGGALNTWVSGVASSGVFVKAAGVAWPSGMSGIPNNWTVIEKQ